MSASVARKIKVDSKLLVPYESKTSFEWIWGELATCYMNESSSRKSSKTEPEQTDSDCNRRLTHSLTAVAAVIRFSGKQFMKQLRCDVRNGVLAPKLSIAIRYIAFRTRMSLKKTAH